MSISGTTTASSAHGDETGLTSLASASPVPRNSITSGLPAKMEQPPFIRGKHQATAMKPAEPKWLQNHPPRRPYSSKEIISIGNMPSNAQLRSLNSKPYLRIRWKAGPDEEPIMLYEAFPKAVAIAFSKVCRESNGISVIIIGGIHSRIKKIFEFMLESAKGEGCAPPPIPEHSRYCTYSRAASDASWIDVPLLQEEYAARRSMIENMQVHSEDVEEIYRDATSKGMAVRENVARSIARKLASKTLKAYPVYVDVRQEFPEFDEDIKKALKEFRKPMEEEKRRVTVDAQRQAWAQQQKEARQAQAVRRQNGVSVGSVGAADRAPPPARNMQPRTVERVQTSLGIIYAAVPVAKESKGKASKGSTKKKITPEEVSEISDIDGKDKDGKESSTTWADEMAEQSGKESKCSNKGRHEG